MMHIAVIGNGPSVLAHRNGTAIDGCDVVVRINRYDTSPRWQPYVGSRTDVWCCYAKAWPATKRRVIAERIKSLWWIEIPAQRDTMRYWKESWIPWCAPHGVTWHEIPRRTIERCYRKLGIQEPLLSLDTLKPTSGMYALVYAREMWPDAKIAIAGFDGYRADEPSYYFDTTTITAHDVRKHAIKRQRAWLAREVAAGHYEVLARG
jgi:hypothetical protein